MLDRHFLHTHLRPWPRVCLEYSSMCFFSKQFLHRLIGKGRPDRKQLKEFGGAHFGWVCPAGVVYSLGG